MASAQRSGSRDQDRQQSTPSSSSDIQIYPLAEFDGEWNMSDELIGSLFAKMEEQDLVKRTFWDGAISNRKQFVGMAKSPRTILQVAFDDSGPLGVAWINGVADNYAFAHFCMFREVWGKRSNEVGRAFVDYWFSLGGDDPVLDVIIGLMPSFNKPAHRFVERVGWKYLGEIPAMFRGVGATIYYISRLEHGQE